MFAINYVQIDIITIILNHEFNLPKFVKNKIKQIIKKFFSKHFEENVCVKTYR